MLGIVTHDDVLDVVTREATEDLQRQAAVGPIEGDYLEASFYRVWRSRVKWLAVLFVAELLTFTAMERFRGTDRRGCRSRAVRSALHFDRRQLRHSGGHARHAGDGPRLRDAARLAARAPPRTSDGTGSGRDTGGHRLRARALLQPIREAAHEESPKHSRFAFPRAPGFRPTPTATFISQRALPRLSSSRRTRGFGCPMAMGSALPNAMATDGSIGFPRDARFAWIRSAVSISAS